MDWSNQKYSWQSCLDQNFQLGVFDQHTNPIFSLQTDNIDTTEVSVTFSNKGNRTDGNGDRVIAIYDNSNGNKKCLVIPTGFGSIKRGNYEGNVGSGNSITVSLCSIIN